MLSDPIHIAELATLLAEVRSDRLLSVDQAAEYLGASRADLENWTRDHLIPCEHVGDQLVFRLADLVDWEIRARLEIDHPVSRARP